MVLQIYLQMDSITVGLKTRRFPRVTSSDHLEVSQPIAWYQRVVA